MEKEHLVPAVPGRRQYGSIADAPQEPRTKSSELRERKKKSAPKTKTKALKGRKKGGNRVIGPTREKPNRETGDGRQLNKGESKENNIPRCRPILKESLRVDRRLVRPLHPLKAYAMLE